MIRRLPLFVLLVVSLLSSCLVSGTSSPNCQLSSLALSDQSGYAITIADANSKSFSSSVYAYYCNCDSTTSVSVKVNSADSGVGYNLRFQSGSGSISTQTLQLRTSSSKFTVATGTNRFDITSSCSSCSKQYTVYCSKKGSGGVHGDPQFSGLRGQDYQVHGVAGEIYNIITDEHIQMNSKFVFLDRGECPIIDGERALACWSHPGSYLGAIGIKTANGDRIKVVSGDYLNGFASVELNGVEMVEGESANLDCPDGDSTGAVTLNSTFLLTVRAGNFEIELENSDMFINQRVRVLDWTSLASHGMLGQTWRRQTYNNLIKHIEGNVDDYAVKGQDLFGDEFTFNLFTDRSIDDQVSANKVDEQAGLDVIAVDPTADRAVSPSASSPDSSSARRRPTRRSRPTKKLTE